MIVPPVPVTVRVYVVVDVGETIFDPFTATAPMPLSSDTEVAFVVDHVSVDELPLTIEVGLAENVAVGAAAVTVTVAVLLGSGLTATLFAVSVYVVVADGLTPVEPLAASVPTPWSIVTLLTVPSVVHASVEEPPGAIDVGDAVNEEMHPPPLSLLFKKPP